MYIYRRVFSVPLTLIPRIYRAVHLFIEMHCDCIGMRKERNRRETIVNCPYEIVDRNMDITVRTLRR